MSNHISVVEAKHRTRLFNADAIKEDYVSVISGRIRIRADSGFTFITWSVDSRCADAIGERFANNGFAVKKTEIDNFEAGLLITWEELPRSSPTNGCDDPDCC